MANEFMLIIDGSSLLSTQYYGNLPREILYAKKDEDKEAFYYKIMQTSDGVYTNGVFGFFKTLFSILEKQKPKYLAICWDLTRDTFRREIYSEYKCNRKKTPEPLIKQFELCQKMLSRIGIVQFSSNEYEADDFAGTLTKRFEKDIPICVMTKDRDYLQLVDDRVSMWLMTSSAAKAQEIYKKHRWKQEENIVPDNMVYLTPDRVFKEFGFLPEKTVMVKQLAGDSADNIPGVKGIGEKTAIVLANAYTTIEEMYDEIRGLDKKGLDEVKKRWKEELGINRSPFSYLLADSEEELVGERASIVSKELATIKRDIPLDDISLCNLNTRIFADELEKVLHELEFHSLSMERIDSEFIEGQSASIRTEVTGVMPRPEQLEEYLLKAEESEAVSLVLCVPELKKKSKMVQMSMFDYMEGKVQDNPEKHISMAFSYNEEQYILLTKENGYSEDDIVNIVNRFYDSGALVVSYDVKEQLKLMTRQQREQLILLESDKPAAFDISVAAYLMNPLKSDYSPYEVCQDYAYPIPNIGELLKGEESEEQLERINDCLGQEAAAGLVCYRQLRNDLYESDMWRLFTDIEMPTAYTLYELTANGVIVDKDALRQYGDTLKGSIEKLEQSIYDSAGHEFNINSPKQLGVVLFEELGLIAQKKTKTGYSTSAEVLESLKDSHPIIAYILEYRQLAKLYSTYVDGLAVYINEDGRIHGHFNQTVTATGRISSTEPNLQNIPMRTELGREIRKVFLPREGCVFVDADYSQIELRILAHMSEDEQLINAFRAGQDIHAITASQVFHVPFDEVTSLQRRNAKAVNFGIVYGISAFGLSEDLGISRQEASDYMDRYFATYPKVKEFLDGLVEQGRQNEQVRTLYQRIRPIPEMHSTNHNQRNFGERVAMNSPIQGTAADIMKIAMIRTYRGLIKERLRSKLVLQIHDELVVEAYEDELEKVKKVVHNAMTDAAQLSVELVVDMNVGKTWYDAK